MSKIKVAIGIPIYNNSDSVQNLINSILALTDYPKDDYKIVVLDDGSKDASVVRDVKRYLDQLDVKIPLIENGVNKGIAYSFNRLTGYYDAECMVLANDDTQVIDKHWLKYLLYFLENNPRVAVVSFSKDPERRLDWDKPTITIFNGYLFAFKKSVWETIEQPGGYTGFWEELTAYSVEFDFCFESAKRNFLSCILPPPTPIKHVEHLTFKKNPESEYRHFSKYLPKEEYLAMIEKFLRKDRDDEFYAANFIKKYLDISPLDIINILRGTNRNKKFKSGKYRRIDGMPCIITERSTGEELACKRFYSFYMFAKKFDIKNIGARNQGPTFTEWYKRYQHVFQQNHLKWLDQELKVREGSAIFSCEQ